MAAIKVIPASENKPKTLRVAAYCRVSSDSADQLHSYAAQIRNYTEVIRKHDDWELVDVYADEGLTGTRMDTRDDFNRMLADCRKGKIDRILVKSISRFARNTRDCLVVLRELSGLGVSVYFEKENIGTETLTTEFMVSVYGALAQEESVSISQNQRMSYRRRMEKGEFITNCAPLGYRIDGKKNLAVVEEEAEIVRWIYESYLSGRSTEWIADELIRRGVPTATGTGAWREESVHRILTNEKYIGDALCQKQYTPDSFPFVRKVNRGDVDQYYIEQTHPAIISKEMFERVQTLRKKRTQSSQNHCSDSPLAHKIVCANCGSSFRRRVSKKGYAVWVCAKHDHHAAECPIGRVSEQEIHAAFARAYRKLKAYADILLHPALKQLSDLNAALQKGNPAMLKVNRAIAETDERHYKITKLMNSGILDETVGGKKLRELNIQMTALRRERRQTLKNGEIEELIEVLRKTAADIINGPDTAEEFDGEMFAKLVDRITVDAQGVRFRLYGGIELREQVRRAGR